MGDYITIASVRRTIGIDTSQVNDDDVTATISEVEKQVPRKFNTVFIPTERIDILDGDGTNRLLLDKNPLLSVRALKIDSTTEPVANLEIYKETGYIFLGEDSTASRFVDKQRKNVVKYLHGTLNYSSTTTSSTAASTAGTSVALAVSSETGFADDSWVEIYGMDGKRETAQITSTDTNEITVDQLVQTHESGSKIVLLEIDENFTKLMNMIAGIALVARVVGESASDTVGYDIGELRVQKGEPYTQWRETANQLIKERDQLYGMIGIRPYTVSI